MLWLSEKISNGQLPDEGAPLELPYRYVADAGVVPEILIDNPQRLFGFEPA